jgi:predicted phosphodiesterase
MRIRTLAALGLALLAGLCQAQHFKFIITGDGRSNGLPGRSGYDDNGINKTIVKELVAETLRQKAKFVLFSGDLVLGYTNEEVFRNQLTSWLILMAPLYDRGIGVYPVRGNHDAYSTNDEAVWTSVLSGRYRLPDNGPEGEKNATWSFEYENALFIGVDEWGKHEHAVNQAWLDEQLAKNKKPHIFVMGHEMAFKAGHHDDNLDNKPAARDAFIDSLFKAGAKVYVCGHDHFYDRTDVSDQAKFPGQTITQLLVGTAGAPFYHGDKHNGNNGSWSLNVDKHIEDTYGYTLVEIDGLNATLTFYGRTSAGMYSPMDSFSYTASAKG